MQQGYNVDYYIINDNTSIVNRCVQSYRRSFVVQLAVHRHIQKEPQAGNKDIATPTTRNPSIQIGIATRNIQHLTEIKTLASGFFTQHRTKGKNRNHDWDLGQRHEFPVSLPIDFARRMSRRSYNLRCLEHNTTDNWIFLKF